MFDRACCSSPTVLNLQIHTVLLIFAYFCSCCFIHPQDPFVARVTSYDTTDKARAQVFQSDRLKARSHMPVLNTTLTMN